MSIKAVIITERHFKEIKEFDSVFQYHAYSEGLEHGASLYAGCCGCYTLEDLVEFDENDPEYKIILKYLGQ